VIGWCTTRTESQIEAIDSIELRIGLYRPRKFEAWEDASHYLTRWMSFQERGLQRAYGHLPGLKHMHLLTASSSVPAEIEILEEWREKVVAICRGIEITMEYVTVVSRR
jgi:hypothetical protein